jgi:hypothetical protein
MSRIRRMRAVRMRPVAFIAASVLWFSTSASADDRGSAWHVVRGEHVELSAQLPTPWQDALSRMSAQQLAELRRGASLDSIVLDGGESLLTFMTTRQLIDVPLAILVEPIGGGSARGGPILIDALLLPKGTGVPNGSLTGGALRLDPLLPGGGGTSGSAQFQLTASVGQPTVATSNSLQSTLKSGFWTPTDAVAITRIFRDGFE